MTMTLLLWAMMLLLSHSTVMAQQQQQTVQKRLLAYRVGTFENADHQVDAAAYHAYQARRLQQVMHLATSSGAAARKLAQLQRMTPAEHTEAMHEGIASSSSWLSDVDFGRTGLSG